MFPWLAVTTKETCELVGALLDAFPAVPSWFADSAAARVLLALRDYFVCIPPDVHAPPRHLTECHQSVSIALSIIEAALALSFEESLSPKSVEGVEIQPSGAKVRGKGVTQRQAKQARRGAPDRTTHLPSLFEDLHIRTPETQSEVTEMLESVLHEQRSILEVKKPDFIHIYIVAK